MLVVNDTESIAVAVLAVAFSSSVPVSISIALRCRAKMSMGRVGLITPASAAILGGPTRFAWYGGESGKKANGYRDPAMD